MYAVAVLAATGVDVTVGVLVLMRSAQRRIGWLLVAQGIWFGALLIHPGASTSGAGMVADQLGAGAWVFLFLWLVLIAYLVPDGHTLSPGWRRWMVCGLAGVAAFLVGSAGDVDGFRDAHHGRDPRLAWLPGTVSGVLGVVGLLLTVLLFFGAAFAVRARLQRSSGVARLQLLWLVWGATSLPLALVLAWLGHFAFDDDPWVVGLALAVAGVALPVTIGIAILRYQLFDIQLVLSRTLTYGVLVTAVVAVYVLLLAGAQRALGDSTVGGVLGVALVAVMVQPAYSAVRRRIERWVYGYRSDPAVALRRLGASVESDDPLQVVETVTASVSDALRVDRVWVAAPGAQVPADPRLIRVPMVHRGELVGDLVVEVPAGRRLSSADTALLHDLARYASVTVRAARLAGELLASRSRIVTAREEERKRLRRELHDGVGPSLAAILLKLEAARSREDPAARDDLLTEIRDETKAAIAEVRRAVDELRPPAIDEVGLSSAIRQRAASLSTDVLRFQVHCSPAPPPIPAAVEVAAFRIASEAMTNVARHSGASRCSVELVIDRQLELTVSDNGRGTGRPQGNGVGWTSMTDRAAELWGILHDLPTRRGRPGGSRDAADGCGSRRRGPDMIRVLVADDHPAYRRGLELMLAEVDDVEVVGMAATGARALELAASLAPDVVLMDLRMPDLDGIEATRRINRRAPAPAPAVVVLTMFDDDESVFTAMRAGARGYLLKGADQDEIVRAIRAVAAGEAIFGPEVAARVVDHFAAGAGSTAAAFPSLTERERELLGMIAAGKGNATIAHELMISLKTVRNHVSNIFTKLQVSDRSGAIVKARRAGLGDDGPRL